MHEHCSTKTTREILELRRRLTVQLAYQAEVDGWALVVEYNVLVKFGYLFWRIGPKVFVKVYRKY